MVGRDSSVWGLAARGSFVGAIARARYVRARDARRRARTRGVMSGNALRRSAHAAVRAAMREGARGAQIAPRGIGAAVAGTWSGAAEGCVDATRRARNGWVI